MRRVGKQVFCSEFYFLADVVGKLVDSHTLLLHSITVTYCYTAILKAVKVVCDAEGGAYFVLTAVTLADGAGIVKVYHKAAGEH